MSVNIWSIFSVVKTESSYYEDISTEEYVNKTEVQPSWRLSEYSDQVEDIPNDVALIRERSESGYSSGSTGTSIYGTPHSTPQPYSPFEQYDSTYRLVIG